VKDIAVTMYSFHSFYLRYTNGVVVALNLWRSHAEALSEKETEEETYQLHDQRALGWKRQVRVHETLESHVCKELV